MSCLADDTVDDFVHGQLAEEARLVVDDHLDTCVDCRSLVAALAQTDHDQGPQAGDPFSLRQGSMVGRYILLKMVGEGAMGVVFAAYDPELHRRVAIKLVRNSAGSLSDRLLREAQAMARLSHANVVTIYETGKVRESVFIAMELISGTTLRQWLLEEPRSTEASVGLLLQAARGLQAAHEAGLVHRDFKPDNVLIAEDGRARVTDFGLARGEEREASDEQEVILVIGSGELTQTMTRTGSLLGTPAYMAPEQLRGESASPSADQYALCVTLYEALCGRRPFAGQSIEALRRAAEQEKPSFQSERSISRALQGVIARGLEAKAENRFPSMKEFIAALEATSAGPSRLWLAGAGIALAGAAAAILFVGADNTSNQECANAQEEIDRVWSSERQSELETSLSSANAPYPVNTQQSITKSLARWRGEWIAESTTTCKATRVSATQSETLMDVRMQCLRRGLSTYDALTRELATATSPIVLRDVEQALPDIAACRDTLSLSAVASPSPTQASQLPAIEALIAKANAQLATGEYAGARHLASDAHERAQVLGYLPMVATSALILARAEQKFGNLAEAMEAIESASGAAIQSRSERTMVSAWIRAVAIYGEAGLYERALQRAQDAEAAFERISEAARLRAMLANSWGTVLYRKGEYPEAREQLERSHRLRVSILGEESTLVARSLTNLGNLERVSGNLQAALDHHRNALALDTKLLGAAHPEIGRHFHNVAGVLRLLDKRHDAVKLYEKALNLRRAALGSVHQDVALTLNSLGLVHSEIGEAEKARAYYQESLRSYPNPKHPQRALSLHGLGVLESAAGEHELAQEHFRQALRIFEKSFDNDHERVIRARTALALSLKASGAPAFKGKKPKTRGPKPTEPKVPKPKVPKPAKPEPPTLKGMYGSSPAWD